MCQWSVCQWWREGWAWFVEMGLGSRPMPSLLGVRFPSLLQPMQDLRLVRRTKILQTVGKDDLRKDAKELRDAGVQLGTA